MIYGEIGWMIYNLFGVRLDISGGGPVAILCFLGNMRNVAFVGYSYKMEIK
jgi:hypothetical protein